MNILKNHWFALKMSQLYNMWIVSYKAVLKQDLLYIQMSTNWWTDEQTVAQSYNRISLSKKRGKIMILQHTNCRIIMLREGSQAQKSTCCTTRSHKTPTNGKAGEVESRLGAAWAWEWEQGVTANGRKGPLGGGCDWNVLKLHCDGFTPL